VAFVATVLEAILAVMGVRSVFRMVMKPINRVRNRNAGLPRPSPGQAD
jgi:hypothetical protein